MKQQGFSLLEILFSLSIGLFLIALMVKLFSLQESLHKDIVNLSTLNRHALIVRQIFTNEIEAAKNIELLDQDHQIIIDHKIFYSQKNNLYVKNINKEKDVAVELMSNVKELVFKREPSAVTISMTVFMPEKCNDKENKKGLCANHSIALYFSVKSNRPVES